MTPAAAARFLVLCVCGLSVAPVLAQRFASADLPSNENRAAYGPVNVPGWPSFMPPPVYASTGQSEGSESTAQQQPVNPSTAGVSMPTDGRCQGVRPGDTVRFTLRIQAVEAAHAVYAHLQMEQGRHPHYRRTDLPLSSDDVLDGGSVGTQDAADPQLYHFSFVVPDAQQGVYHPSGIAVRAAFGAGSSDPGTLVALDRQAQDEVRRYCIAVFGDGNGEHQPTVTEFLPAPPASTSREASVAPLNF